MPLISFGPRIGWYSTPTGVFGPRNNVLINIVHWPRACVLSSHLSIHYGFSYTFYILIFIRWTTFLSSFLSYISVCLTWLCDTTIYRVRDNYRICLNIGYLCLHSQNTILCCVTNFTKHIFPWFTIHTFIFSQVLQLREYMCCNNLIADKFNSTNIVYTTLII